MRQFILHNVLEPLVAREAIFCPDNMQMAQKATMRLSTIRWALWSLVAIAAAGFAWLQYSNGSYGDQNSPAFQAKFELTDHNGEIRTEDDFAGRWLLVFFGFANCPDICPTTLAEVAVIMDELGSASEQVQPLFITIDPERDTPARLAEFVPQFHSDIIGLSGTPNQIEQTSKAFRIFYEKIEEAQAPDGYTMGHSSQLFLFDPAGGYVGAWLYGTSAEEILTDLKAKIAS